MGMFNILNVSVKCPHCKYEGDMEAEFKFGFLNMDKYKLGDTLTWIGGGKPYHKGRPADGNFVGEGYVECPNCHRDFWLIIKVTNDKLESVQVNDTKAGY